MSMQKSEVKLEVHHLTDAELDAARGGNFPLPARMTAFLPSRSSSPTISEITITKLMD